MIIYNIEFAPRNRPLNKPEFRYNLTSQLIEVILKAVRDSTKIIVFLGLRLRFTRDFYELLSNIVFL